MKKNYLRKGNPYKSGKKSGCPGNGHEIRKCRSEK